MAVSGIAIPSTNPIDDEELYNQLELGPLESPGKLTLSGHDREIEWDVKTGSGTSGGTTTRKGMKPQEFTATFYLVKDEGQGIDDFEAWDEFAALLFSTISGKTPKALDIYHPDLARNDIKSVVLKSMGGMVHDGKGGATVVVKLLEYKPPKPAGGTPDASRTRIDDSKDPNQAAKNELARLTALYEKTPAG